MGYFVLKYRGFYVAKRDRLLLTRDRKYSYRFRECDYDDACRCLRAFDKPRMAIRKVCLFGLVERTVRSWKPIDASERSGMIGGATR